MKKSYTFLTVLFICAISFNSIAQSVSLPQASLSATPLPTVENFGTATGSIVLSETSGTNVPSQAFGEPNVTVSIDLQYIELRDHDVTMISGEGMDYFSASYDVNTNILLLSQKTIIPGDWSGAIDFPIAVIQNSTQPESFNGFNANIAAIDAGTNAEGNASIFTYTDEDVLAVNTVKPLLFEVSPNPSNGILNISFNESIDAKVELFDLTGKFILAEEYSNLETVSLNIQDLASAVYLLKVTSNDASNSIRIIKE
jgi:hypothetical protein